MADIYEHIMTEPIMTSLTQTVILPVPSINQSITIVNQNT